MEFSNYGFPKWFLDLGASYCKACLVDENSRLTIVPPLKKANPWKCGRHGDLDGSALVDGKILAGFARILMTLTPGPEAHKRHADTRRKHSCAPGHRHIRCGTDCPKTARCP
jgi:hypothetical protein